MTGQAAEIERRFCDCLRDEAAVYRRALEAAQSISSRFADRSGGTDDIREMETILRQIAAMSERSQTCRSQWQKLHVEPGQHLQETINRVQSLLEELIQEINVAETHAQASRDRLSPQLSLEARRQSMRQTYCQ